MARRRNGEGSISRRKDGRWQASVTLADGTRRQAIGRDYETVARKLNQLLHERDSGVLIPRSDLTVGEYLDQWLEDIAKPKLRPSSYETCRGDVRRAKPLIGTIRLEDLKPATLQAAYGRLQKSGLSPRSVQRVHTTLHRAFKQAVQFELLIRNPAEIARPPRAPRIEMRTLAADEVRRLFESSRDHRLHALWVLLATSGMRIGEALGLMWSDVDLDVGRVQVRRALQRQAGVGFAFTEPKTNRSRRSIFVPLGTVAALHEHRRRQQDEKEIAGPLWEGEHDLVFLTAKGRPIEQGHVHWTLTKTLERAGLPRIRVHDLRHTAASILLERGVHPKIVQEMLGHSTITLTLDTYSHVIPSLQATASSQLQTLFAITSGREEHQI